MGRLEGKVAVVTCGVRGIGRGIVEAFAAEGADFAAADILSEGEAAPVLARVERLGQRGLYVRTDVLRGARCWTWSARSSGPLENRRSRPAPTVGT